MKMQLSQAYDKKISVQFVTSTLLHFVTNILMLWGEKNLKQLIDCITSIMKINIMKIKLCRYDINNFLLYQNELIVMH